MELQLLVMIYVRSLREADFKLYLESLAQIVPWFFSLDHTNYARESLVQIVTWFFSLDHTNYARWIPVHLRDMVTLAEKHPAVHQEFMNGNFTVNKTGRTFSNIFHRPST